MKTENNFWRVLVEDFLSPVIKPPGTYFNNKLLPSYRSSKFSHSFPTTSVLLCAPLDPISFLVLGKQKKNSARNKTRICTSRPDTVALFLLFFFFSISRRDGENNGFLAGVPFLLPPSRGLAP